MTRIAGVVWMELKTLVFLRYLANFKEGDEAWENGA